MSDGGTTRATTDEATGGPATTAAGGMIAAVGAGVGCPEGWSLVGSEAFGAAQLGLCFRAEAGTTAVFPDDCPAGWSRVGTAHRPDRVSCSIAEEIDVLAAYACPAGWDQVAVADAIPICTRPRDATVPVLLTHDATHEPLDDCPGGEAIEVPSGRMCMVPGASVLLRTHDETGLEVGVGTPCPFDYEHLGYAGLGAPPIDYAACVASHERVLAWIETAADGTPLFVDAPCPDGWISRSVRVRSTPLGQLSFAICEWAEQG